MRERNLNRVHLEGYVYNISGKNGRDPLSLKVSGPNSKTPGTPFISGNLDIATDEEGLNITSVHFSYVTEKTKKGNKNETFSVLKKIIDNSDRCWISSGKETAFKVSADCAVALNDFYNKDDERVSSKMVEGSFCSFVDKFSTSRNKFELDMLITKITRKEANPEKYIDKDYMTLFGVVFNFRNEILPIELVIKDEKGMSYLEDQNISNSNPYFTKLWGCIDNKVIKIEKVEESAFGEDAVTVYEREFHEWVVKGMPKVPYDYGDEEVLTKEDIDEAIKTREVHWADIKKRKEEYESSKAVGSGADAVQVPSAPGMDNIATGGFKF